MPNPITDACERSHEVFEALSARKGGPYAHKVSTFVSLSKMLHMSALPLELVHTILPQVVEAMGIGPADMQEFLHNADAFVKAQKVKP